MNPTRQSNRLRWIVNAVVFLFLTLSLYNGSVFVRSQVSDLPGRGLFRPTDQSPIPNIVHFVRLMPSTTPAPSLEFSFHHFIAVYSALLYLDPNVIYIHTNGDNQTIAAAKASPNIYTRTIANLPKVQFNQKIPPTKTTATGLAIEKLAHQADFIRTEMLKGYGGLYLDDDAYVLRNMAPLRQLGFQNVVGVQADGNVCNAVMLAAQGPRNLMLEAYYQLQDKVFDGGWTTHSVDLLASLTRAFSAHENQVLTLHRHAFFSGSWVGSELTWMYEVHNDNGDDLATPNTETGNSTAFVQNFRLRPARKSWIHDWRPSYVLHGWNSAMEHFVSDHAADPHLFGDFGGITLDYVLSRRSNFARAVYPAVKHALDHDVLVPTNRTGTDTESRELN